MRQKPYLLRTAIYVLLLPAVCVIPFALAQRNASKRSVAKPAATDILNAAIPGGVCQFHVLIVYADPKPPTQLQSEIQAEPNVVAVDVFDATVGIPTLGELQQYDIVVPFSDISVLRRRHAWQQSGGLRGRRRDSRAIWVCPCRAGRPSRNQRSLGNRRL